MAYIYGTPVTGLEFYGRESLLAELTQFSSSTTYFLNGIRRIGKSSMLKEIERLTKNVGYASLYIDLLGGYSSEDFGAELCRIIENYFYDNKIEFIEDEWVDLNFENAFEKWTQYCQENNKKSFLLIDEAEKLHKMTPKNMELLTKRIRDYRPVVQVILTGTRLFWRYDAIQRPDLTAFQDLLTQQYIGMVSQEDAVHIVTRKKADKQIIVSENDFHKIWEACGGHPYLLQYVCNSHHKDGNLVFDPTNTPISYNDQLRNVFLNDFGLMDATKQGLLKAVAGSPNTGYSSIFDPDFRVLAQLGIINKIDNKYYLYANLFAKWVLDEVDYSPQYEVQKSTDILDTQLSNNSINWNEPVRGSHFVGRKELIRNIISGIFRNSFCVLDTKSSGKTSLLLKLEEELSKDDIFNGEILLFPKYLTLKDFNEASFWQKIMQAIVDAIPNVQDSRVIRSKYDYFDFLSDIKIIHSWDKLQGNRRVVLLIDDIHLIDNYPQPYKERFRSVFSGYGQIQVIVVGKEIDLRADNVFSSPWYNFLYFLDMPNFTPEESMELIKMLEREYSALTDDGRAWILEHAYFQPKAIQQLCYQGMQNMKRRLGTHSTEITPRIEIKDLTTINLDIY
jgi:hypothetical protein